MFVTTDAAKQLCLKGIDQEISLSNVISSKKLFQSELVKLDISLNLNSEKSKIKNCMGCQLSELPPICFNLDQVKHPYGHMTDIDFNDVDIDSDI